MAEFHETGYGRRFFDSQLPRLIDAMERVGAELRRWNDAAAQVDLGVQELKATEYELDAETRLCRVKQRGASDDMWAIRRNGFTLNTDGEFEHEPQPSSRTDDYMQRNRYATADGAMTIWDKLKREKRG